MKLASKSALGLALLIGLTACGGEKTAQVAEYPALILGNWECDYHIIEDGVTASGTLDVVYRRDGSTSRVGDFIMKVDDNRFEFTVNLDSEYGIEGAILDETIKSVSLDNLKIEGPILRQMDEATLIGLMKSEIQKSFEDDEVISSRIDVLNQDTFKFTELEEGDQESCKRAG